MPIRILIADDNQSVRAAMRQVLEGLGEHWEVIEAQDGNEAVAKARELRPNPNLVILDLVMPSSDGLTASREIAKLLPDVPILMHTLYSSPEVIANAEKASIRRVVPKSESSELVSAVQEILQPKPGASDADSRPDSSDLTKGHRRRTEDKIRELCDQLFAISGYQPDAAVAVELRSALHQHIEQLRSRVAKYPIVVERRARLRIPLDARSQAD